MKKINLSPAFLAVIILLLITSCNRSPINKIFEDVKDNENGVFAVTIPGWLVSKGIKLGLKNNVIEEDLTAINAISGGIKKVRVLFAESMENKSLKAHLDKSVSSLEKYDFSPYVYIKDKDARVSVWAKEKNNRLNDLFVYINSDEETALVHIETDISVDDFTRLSKSFSKSKK